MTSISARPVSRCASPGNRNTFRLEITGDGASSVRVMPRSTAEGYRIALNDGGMEASGKPGILKLDIDVPPDACTGRVDFSIEARDASGTILARENVEIITGGRWMVPASTLAAVLGGWTVAASANWGDGWPYTSILALGSVVGAAGVASLVFYFWGRLLGFARHFTS